MQSKSTNKIKRRSTSKSRTQAADLPSSYSRVEFLLINPMSIRGRQRQPGTLDRTIWVA
jgi:hypothetical protein